MQVRVPGPLSERLSKEIKDDSTCTEQEYQTHVGHDRWDEASGDGPWCDELGETVAPDVLINGNGDHDRAGNRLIAVDGISGRNGRYGGDLNTRTGVADDDDGLVGLSKAQRRLELRCLPSSPTSAGTQMRQRSFQ